MSKYKGYRVLANICNDKKINPDNIKRVLTKYNVKEKKYGIIIIEMDRLGLNVRKRHIENRFIRKVIVVTKQHLIECYDKLEHDHIMYQPDLKIQTRSELKILINETNWDDESEEINNDYTKSKSRMTRYSNNLVDRLEGNISKPVLPYVARKSRDLTNKEEDLISKFLMNNKATICEDKY